MKQKMKRILLFALLALTATVALAQTPQEIIQRMDQALEQHKNDGVAMTVEIKIPIVGMLSTRSYILDKKMRMEGETNGEKYIVWIDGDTQWSYSAKDNTVTIKKDEKKDAGNKSGGDMKLFENVAEGYDLSLAQETGKSWQILCKKSRTNRVKDDPKQFTLVVAKGSCLPLSLETKMSGVGFAMRNLSFGVSEDKVTYHPEDTPGAKIDDLRQ